MHFNLKFLIQTVVKINKIQGNGEENWTPNPHHWILRSPMNPLVRVGGPIMGAAQRESGPKSGFQFFFEVPKLDENWSESVNRGV